MEDQRDLFDDEGGGTAVAEPPPKDETTKPPAGNSRAQQRKFNSFRQEFNEVRPHEALDMNTPAQLYQPSSRPMPSPRSASSRSRGCSTTGSSATSPIRKS